MGFRTMEAGVVKPRLIVSVEGGEKCGKNHFAFTAPGPIGLHSFDFGTEGMVEKFLKGNGVPRRKIDMAQYAVNVPEGAETQTVSNACTPVWNAFRTNYAIGLGKYRTTVVDTATDAYEMVRLSHFGKLQQVMAHHYAPVNTEMKSLFRQAYSSDGNLVMLCRIKDEYITKMVGGKEKAEKTGTRIMAGYKDTKFETQVHLRMYKEVGADPWRAEIVTCRHNPDLEGFVLEGEMLSFAGLGQMVYPDSDPGDWE